MYPQVFILCPRQQKPSCLHVLQQFGIGSDSYRGEKDTILFSDSLQGKIDVSSFYEEDEVKKPKISPHRSVGVYYSKQVDTSFASVVQGRKKQEVVNSKGSNKVKSTNIAQLRQEIMEDVNKSIQTKVDSLDKKMEKKINEFKMEQDSKIDSLMEVVKQNHVTSEVAALQRERVMEEKMKVNNNVLLQDLYRMIKSGNPPGVTVEQEGSRDGGSQK